MHEDELAIRQLIRTWLEASVAGDTATVLALMAEDVVFLRAGKPPICGRTAFAAMQSGQGRMKIEASGDIQEITVFGDWAYCWNKLSVSVSPEAGASVTQSGNVLSIFRRSEEGWQLFRDANLLS